MCFQTWKLCKNPAIRPAEVARDSFPFWIGGFQEQGGWAQHRCHGQQWQEEDRDWFHDFRKGHFFRHPSRGRMSRDWVEWVGQENLTCSLAGSLFTSPATVFSFLLTLESFHHRPKITRFFAAFIHGQHLLHLLPKPNTDLAYFFLSPSQFLFSVVAFSPAFCCSYPLFLSVVIYENSGAKGLCCLHYYLLNSEM